MNGRREYSQNTERKKYQCSIWCMGAWQRFGYGALEQTLFHGRSINSMELRPLTDQSRTRFCRETHRVLCGLFPCELIHRGASCVADRCGAQANIGECSPIMTRRQMYLAINGAIDREAGSLASLGDPHSSPMGFLFV